MRSASCLMTKKIKRFMIDNYCRLEANIMWFSPGNCWLFDGE